MTDFTGVHGIVTVDGGAIAIGECDIKFSRDISEYVRTGKYSKLKIPGGLDATGTIRRIQIDGDLMEKVMGAATTGTAVELHAGVAPPTAGTNTIDDMTDPAALSSIIQLEYLTQAVSAAGRLTLSGTDVNDAQQVEILTIAEGAAGTTVDSTKVFKTVEFATMVDYAQVDGTIGIDAITSRQDISAIGPGEYFDLVGYVESGSYYIKITLTNCWFTEGGIHFTDADSIVEESLPFVVKDLDVGTLITHVTA